MLGFICIIFHYLWSYILITCNNIFDYIWILNFFLSDLKSQIGPYASKHEFVVNYLLVFFFVIRSCSFVWIDDVYKIIISAATMIL